jgi:hypothetical protein
MTETATCTGAPGGVLDADLDVGLADSAPVDAAGSVLFCAGTCATGYEDLDGQVANGCETKTPKVIQATSLQLWLRSDRDVTCGSDAGAADLTLWKDQSGKGHDATTPAGASVGGAAPQCTTATDGINLLPTIHFTRGGDFTKDDGTLSVDLAFLTGDYTIFAVDRRTDVVSGDEWLLGSIAPGTDCSVTSNLQKAFRFGYRSNTEFGLGQLCGGDLVATIAGTDVVAKPVSLDVGWFSMAATGGHKVERNNAVLNSDTALVPLLAATGGAIGRGYVKTTETRFQGDIAELLVYTSALSDADKADVVAYLKTHWHLP